MSDRPARVLDVGNCDPDHGMIRAVLTQHFNVEIDRVMFVDDAIDRMKKNAYALVLVNRLIFEDGSEGMELHRRVKADPALAGVPIMMISNYEQAQAASVAAGGVPGFGKAEISRPATVALLANYLPRRG